MLAIQNLGRCVEICCKGGKKDPQELFWDPFSDASEHYFRLSSYFHKNATKKRSINKNYIPQQQ